MIELIQRAFAANLDLHKKAQDTLSLKIDEACKRMVACTKANGTIFWAGNGGSAADAQHMAAELIGRFKRERRPIKSIALTCNTSTLTALGNDYSFDKVFCRELEAFGQQNDVLLAISTSGNSKNILEVAKLAKKIGVFVIALTGETGGLLSQHSDLLLNVPSQDTARIQEVHLMIEHLLCESVESATHLV